MLSETHDFSRAVDGLVKEIYLGMIFLQLQVFLSQYFPSSKRAKIFGEFFPPKRIL